MSTNRKIAGCFANWLADVIFPKFCLNCNQEGQHVCPDCFNKIKINSFPICYKCEKRSLNSKTCLKCRQKTSLNGLIVAGLWEDELLRQIIYEFKYRFIKEIRKELSQTLIKSIKMNYQTLLNNDSIITFVPLNKRRQIWRGFNQAELLAEDAANYFKLPHISLLERKRNTSPQAEIKSQNERKNNMKHAFSLKEITNYPLSFFKDKTIILVDDVCTTGATLEECTKTLKILKPKEIWGLVLARG